MPRSVTLFECTELIDENIWAVVFWSNKFDEMVGYYLQNVGKKKLKMMATTFQNNEPKINYTIDIHKILSEDGIYRHDIQTIF